jgi:hypothetical protein
MAMVRCPECGMGYCDDVRQDVKQHDQKHGKFLTAKNKFGFMYHHDERERIKGETAQIYHDATKSTEEKMVAYEKMFKVYFARSFEASDF